MISVIKSLMAGDKDIVDKFSKADDFWKKFFEAHKNDDVKTLAHALDREQGSFEHELGWERALAKEIMPYTCIAYLYDERDGFADNRALVRRVVLAFAQSMCSLEVKSRAETAALLFHVDHD